MKLEKNNILFNPHTIVKCCSSLTREIIENGNLQII